MSDLQNGQPRVIKIQNSATGLFEDFFRQDTGTGIEIVNHGALFKFERQRYPLNVKCANYCCSSTSATPPEIANFMASAELMSVNILILSRITKYR